MKSIFRIPSLLLAAMILAPIADADIPHVENGSHPTQTIRNWHLKEQWRAGPEGENFLFGRIVDVAVDATGNTFLLDFQQQETYVFDPSGKFHSKRGHAGEGPGETTMASRLLLDSERMGLMNRFPAEIVWLDSAGDPAGALTPVLPDDPEAILGGWFARLRHGRLHLALGASRFTENGMTTTLQIGECAPDGTLRNISVQLGNDYYTHGSRDDQVDEGSYFNPLEGRWDVDRNGRTWIAPHRDSYLLEVFEPTGEPALTTGREFVTPPRPARQITRIRRSLEERWKNSGNPILVGDRSPCIDKLWIMEEPWGDEVWIESAASFHDLPSGVMVRYDLFDLAGRFTHQVDIVGEGDPLFDRWYLMGNNRLVMVRNASSGGFDEEDPQHPRFVDGELEVISYRIIWEE